MRCRSGIYGIFGALVLLWLGPAISLGAAPMSDATSLSTITQVPFGKTTVGTPVELYTLRNRHGMEARIMTYGGIITNLTAPDRKGHFADVVLGYDTLPEYFRGTSYFGALIGRYGNRIGHAQFTLDGVKYKLAANNGPNSLHGGLVGFDKVVWQVEGSTVTAQGPQLSLAYVSRNGEEGFPGNLKVKAVYTLTEDNTLRLEFTAVTDKDTPVNLTQHSYFNLRGHGDILGHVLEIPADRFTPVDDTLIPNGELRPVSGTAFDFRKATAIGARIGAADEQLKFGKGYDHNYVLNKAPGVMGPVATVYEPETGRVLEVDSTEPGVQFYSGNFLDGKSTGKGGWAYEFRNGLALEPQHFPDSPNEAKFPAVILHPGETYRHTLVYRFTVR